MVLPPHGAQLCGRNLGMSDVIIRAEGIGKKYRIRHERAERYTALRDVIAEKVRGLFIRGKSKAIGIANLNNSTDTLMASGKDVENTKSDFPSDCRVSKVPSVEDFWALRDVSFEVNRGDVVGIIGRNGAGKSTLLKILSRITEPTEGRVELDGRVASLLEVGTGFHPELTGRENIFLNGAILGMTRAEVRRKFDEIVAFAEVEQFLDTPVKRYSSGMYVRLAFSVAAHLEPEILVVDEVLAVGDAEFQKKCLGKMREVSKGGRTVLFVSHNMAAVQALCSSAISLDSGRIIFDGQSAEAVSRYLNASPSHRRRSVNHAISSSLSLTRFEADPLNVRQNAQLNFNIELLATREEVVSDLALIIHSALGERAALIDLRSQRGPYRLRAGGKLALRTIISAVPFVEADFNLGLYINSNSVSESFPSLLTFTVMPGESNDGVVPRDPQFRGLVELGAFVESRVS